MASVAPVVRRSRSGAPGPAPQGRLPRVGASGRLHGLAASDRRGFATIVAEGAGQRTARARYSESASRTDWGRSAPATLPPLRAAPAPPPGTGWSPGPGAGARTVRRVGSARPRANAPPARRWSAAARRRVGSTPVVRRPPRGPRPHSRFGQQPCQRVGVVETHPHQPVMAGMLGVADRPNHRTGVEFVGLSPAGECGGRCDADAESAPDRIRCSARCRRSRSPRPALPAGSRPGPGAAPRPGAATPPGRPTVPG